MLLGGGNRICLFAGSENASAANVRMNYSRVPAATVIRNKRACFKAYVLFVEHMAMF